MQGEQAIPGINDDRAALLVFRPAIAHFGATSNAIQRFLGNAMIDGIDNATDGTTAIQQGCRTANDVYLLDDQWINRDGMVEAQA